MKKFKNFLNENNQELKNEIIKYLEEKYPEYWWNSQLSERVFDYIGDDDLIGDGDEDDESTWEYTEHEEAYKNLCTGGAIEYDILDQINNEVMLKFNIDKDDFYRSDYDNIVNDYMIDTIDWYDSFVFKRSDEKNDQLHGLNW